MAEIWISCRVKVLQPGEGFLEEYDIHSQLSLWPDGHKPQGLPQKCPVMSFPPPPFTVTVVCTSAPRPSFFFPVLALTTQ